MFLFSPVWSLPIPTHQLILPYSNRLLTTPCFCGDMCTQMQIMNIDAELVSVAHCFHTSMPHAQKQRWELPVSQCKPIEKYIEKHPDKISSHCCLMFNLLLHNQMCYRDHTFLNITDYVNENTKYKYTMQMLERSEIQINVNVWQDRNDIKPISPEQVFLMLFNLLACIKMTIIIPVV